MDLAKLRAWWFHRQALDGRLAGRSIADVLNECGWARSVGGCAPYLGLFARVRAGRAAVDAALAKVEIHELPAVRGCTYVVAKQDFALALQAGAPYAGDEMKVARKLGVSDSEIDKLGDAVVKALKDGPLDPDGLKAALGAVVRNLGDEGKKKGITTTLPVALGLLQSAGRIRRIPVNGRLDQQRYQYAAWELKIPSADSSAELAARYFQWIGPATLAEFQWFSGLGAKAAKAAAGDLQDIGGGFLMDDASVKEFQAFKVPNSPQYALVGSIDSMILLRRNLKTLIDDVDLTKVVPLAGVADLPSHAILDRGRIIGLWEYDPESESIAWATFSGRADAALKKRIAEMESFVRNDLGDARSFSLDSPKSRAPRIAALRE